MLEISLPATTTNFGCGLDSCGLALSVRARYHVKRSKKFSITTNFHKNPLSISYSEENITLKSYLEAWKILTDKKAPPISVDLYSHFPISSGLGSSATAVLAGVISAFHIYGEKIKENLDRVAHIAARIEGHADNVLASLFGGFVTCSNDVEGKLVWEKGSFPSLTAIVVVPKVEMKTEETRKVLPPLVSIEEATKNIGRAMLLIEGIRTKNYKLMRLASYDEIHQQRRFEAFLPCGGEVINAALESGAVMSFLSGGGPSLIAFSVKGQKKILNSMKRKLRENSVEIRSAFIAYPSEMGMEYFYLT